LSVVVLGLAAFVWQQQGGDGGGPLNAIAQAAEKTEGETGGRAVMRVLVRSPGRSEPITMTGWSIFNAEGRTREVLRMPNPKSDGTVKLETVTDGNLFYIRSRLFGALPGGSEWMKLDPSLGQEPETPAPADVDAKGELELLESVSDDVQVVGRENVRGVPTTRYRGTLESAESDSASAPLQVEVWVDAHELVRRTRLFQPRAEEGGEESTSIDMRMDFFDWGIDPEIEVPDSSEVFDATPLAEEQFSSDD